MCFFEVYVVDVFSFCLFFLNRNETKLSSHDHASDADKTVIKNMLNVK